MLMSGRIIPTTGEPPTPLSFDSALELSCHLSVSFSLQIGDQGLVEFDLSSCTQLILIGLCYTLVLCHSFKSCALPPSLLFYALFLSPFRAHNVPSRYSGIHLLWFLQHVQHQQLSVNLLGWETDTQCLLEIYLLASLQRHLGFQ